MRGLQISVNRRFRAEEGLQGAQSFVKIIFLITWAKTLVHKDKVVYKTFISFFAH